MRFSVLLAVGGLITLTVAALSLRAGSGVHGQGTTSVEVGDSWFCDVGDSACMTTDVDDVDLVTTVDVGDTVDWTWVGSLPHTTTACSGSDFATCDQSQGWDSGIQTSGTFSFTFTQPATFYYRCNVHPDQMRGQITVVAPAEPSPSPQPTPQASPEASPQPTPQASPEASPQPSPQASLQASPEASPQPSPQPITPTPAGLQAMAVPAGGGAPPDAGGSSMLWWLAVAAGALLVVSAVVLVSRLPRH